MCIPEVTLQFYFVFLFVRQQKSEFEDADSIIGIDLRWTISNNYEFLSFFDMESNGFNLILSK